MTIWSPTIYHSALGQSWKNHKYIRKEGDRYIYNNKDRRWRQAKKELRMENHDDFKKSADTLNERNKLVDKWYDGESAKIQKERNANSIWSDFAQRRFGRVIDYDIIRDREQKSAKKWIRKGKNLVNKLLKKRERQTHRYTK